MRIVVSITFFIIILLSLGLMQACGQPTGRGAQTTSEPTRTPTATQAPGTPAPTTSPTAPITVIGPSPTARPPTGEGRLREEPTPTSIPGPTGPQLPTGTNRLTSLAIDDLSGRLNTPRDQIQVVKVEAVDWPDASLGCPEPGKLYAQVITPGYRIILSDGQKQYEYHTDQSNQLVLCEGGQIGK